ncbi:hypothetical protein BUE93_04845 [Chromobacterium amazonense]|uniref:FRG domain-containing protein n=1 Tax=Chromobacterium amazonense TaxID=1382803 RepID=A0A2S9X7P6_9NEIS|nr:FRG domain-containing protein [Chromobacterium amazonense]PRP71738.1 hypothetical protein BUE93_04845 [Chromobacterium amazonense]
MKEIKASDASISSIINIIQENFKQENIWFRGQSKYKYNLQPAIFRETPGEFFSEGEMLKEFIRSQPEQSAHHKNTYDWLALMQHYGLPTRLLDWSSNLLVALYFCCEKDNEENGAIFAINPALLSEDVEAYTFIEPLIECEWENYGINSILESKFVREVTDGIKFRKHAFEIKINNKTIQEFYRARLEIVGTSIEKNSEEPGFNIENFEIIEYETAESKIILARYDLIRFIGGVISFKPPHLNPRIRQQHGFFTLHGGKLISGRTFIKPPNIEEMLEENCVKIEVSGKDKIKIMAELKFSGIEEHTLFPEIEKQAKYIKNKFTIKKKT